MANFIMAIDQGTTGSRALLMDESGRVIHKAYREFPQSYPQPGWVEHNPEEIWESVCDSIRSCLESSGVKATQVAAIGITNQRETVVAWDRDSGKPVGPAIVWQCRRTAKDCESLRKRGFEREIRRKTGLVIDPYFSSTKMTWILKNRPQAQALAKSGRLCLGTIDAFLIWRLSNGESFVTDVTNASRTQLMDLKKLDYDQDLLKLYKVPRASLPDIRPSSGELARTRGMEILPDGIPIAGVAGDQQAALFGQTCFKVGEAKITFGTGSFLLMNVGSEPIRSKAGLLTTVAWQLAGQNKATYALEGGAFICGALIQWLRDQLGFFESSSEVEKMAHEVQDTAGVQFVPAFVGLGAPYWNSEARGLICGLTRGTTKAHIARASLEAMALQNADILFAMEKDLKKKLRSVRVDGGAAVNDLLMQMQSDFVGVGVDRPVMTETTSAGAAYLAGLGVGIWKSVSDIQKIWQKDRSFKPILKTAQRKARHELWTQAVRAAEVYANG